MKRIIKIMTVIFAVNLLMVSNSVLAKPFEKQQKQNVSISKEEQNKAKRISQQLMDKDSLSGKNIEEKKLMYSHCFEKIVEENKELKKFLEIKKIYPFIKDSFKNLNKKDLEKILKLILQNEEKKLKETEQTLKNIEKNPKTKKLKEEYTKHQIDGAESFRKVGKSAPGNEGKSQEEIEKEAKKMEKAAKNYSGKEFKKFVNEKKDNLNRKKFYLKKTIKDLKEIINDEKIQEIVKKNCDKIFKKCFNKKIN